MSAFMVSNTDIDAMITAALAWTRDDGALRFYRHDNEGGPTEEFVLNSSTADLVGAILLVENQRSVNFRYREDDLEPVYTFTRLPGRPGPVAVLKIVACYEYQSCEHPEWRNSAAAGFCHVLRSRAISQLPGWETAPWGTDDPDVFRTAVRADEAKHQETGRRTT
jgi:hypothetical protein